MVKQTPADILDMLIGSGSDLGELLTPDGDVIGFSNYRPMDSGVDFLDDDVLDPLDIALCQDIQDTAESSADDIDPEHLVFTFDPSDTSIEILQLMEAASNNEACLSPLEDLVNVQDGADLTDAEEAVSPLLKQEIKNRIQKRRQVEGKEDFKELFVQPPPETLTHDEMKKRIEKRVKNKHAAQKCRSKKRKIADCLEEETERLAEKQEKLKDEVRRLRDERDHLLELVSVHASVCPRMACAK